MNRYIYINKNPSGRLWNFLFGLAELIDAVVRIGTFGIVCTGLTLICSKYQAKSWLVKLKKARQVNS